MVTTSAAIDWWASARWYAQRAALVAGLPLSRGSPERQSAAGIVPPRFDRRYYLRSNADVALAGYDPLAHYLRFGRGEGRGGSPAEEPALHDGRATGSISRRWQASRPAVSGAVDVIVPVYGSAALTLQTIDSVLAAPTRRAFELVVVDDASPDLDLRRTLAGLAESGLLTLLVNERNIGFAGSVNRGLALHPDRDVVLLNSDTCVFGDWLDRLLDTLGRDPCAGTVTPLSNAATILSYPIRLRDNVLVSPLRPSALDETCRELALPPVPVPTAIGFCMAIRRSCLDRVGVFDDAQFGRGYGEENDFCCRASRAGWHHLAAANIFVWHRGGASFGTERQQRNAAAQRVLARLHPGYRASVRRFIRRDPLRTVRAALDAAAIRAAPGRRLLHLDPAPRERRQGMLHLQLVADLPPYAGRYRVVARSRHATLNLPRIDRYQPIETLASLLRELQIDGLCGDGTGGMDPVLRARLAGAAALARVAVIHV